MQHHGYSLTDIENMIPWELDIFYYMVVEQVKTENEQNKSAMNQS